MNHCLCAGLPCLVERQGARDRAECEPFDCGPASGGVERAGGQAEGGVRRGCATNAPSEDAAISRDSLPSASRSFKVVERV